MGLKAYVEHHELEGEPVGRTLLTASDASGTIEKKGDYLTIDNKGTRDLATVMEDIGIKETDTIEDVRTKILFTLKAMNSGNLGKFCDLLSWDPQELAQIEADCEKPITLELISGNQLVDLATGSKERSATEIIRDHKSTKQEDVIKYIDGWFSDDLEKSLVATLRWLME